MNETSKVQVKEINRITYAGVVVNISLAVLKFAAGFIGNSQALIADAVHSLSDLSTDFAILFGVKHWTKPPDDEHPYGHGRIETCITLIISVVLFAVALGIGYNSLASLRVSHASQPCRIAFFAALISIIAKEILFRFTLKTGRRLKSSAVVANAWHHRTDALSSIPVAIAVAIAVFNAQWSFLDHIGALVVSIFILHVAFKMIKNALAEILDTSASKAYKTEIEKIVRSTEGVKFAHKFRTRRVGSGWYIDLHIKVDPSMTVKKGHDVSELVKMNLMKNGEDIIDVVVHLEPSE